MARLIFEVSASLAVWPADISAIVSTLNFELLEDYGIGVCRSTGRPRTRSTPDIVDAAAVDLDEASVLALAIGRVNGAMSEAAATLSATANLGLTMNIMEAMWSDYQAGNKDNAEAGYELAVLDGLFDFTRQANRARHATAESSMF